METHRHSSSVFAPNAPLIRFGRSLGGLVDIFVRDDEKPLVSLSPRGGQKWDFRDGKSALVRKLRPFIDGKSAVILAGEGGVWCGIGGGGELIYAHPKEVYSALETWGYEPEFGYSLEPSHVQATEPCG